MFGQSNTPFGSSAGAGGFGQQATNTAPAFGSPAPAPGGLFGGAAAPAAPFGAPAPAQPAFGAPAFGQPQATAGGAFGQPQAAAPAGGLFGAPQQATGGFGGTTGFGAAPAAPAPGAFGAPAPGAFGAPAPAPFGGGFGGGSTTTGAFGAAPSPAPGGLFGSNAPAPAFGAPAPGGFGAPASGGGGLFGAPAPAPAAGGGLFGQSAAPAFGSPTPAPFGTTTTGTTFGAPAPSGGGLFGAPAATSPAPAAPFGAPAAATTFGAQPAAGAGQGTRATPYQVTSTQDGTSSINIQSITAMQAYQNQSFEELRFQDYSQGNKGSASTPTASGAGGGFFGSAPAAPAPAGGLFGAPAPAPATGGLLFGGAAPTPAPGFGSTFNAPAAPAGGGLFGGPAPAPAAPGTGLFGASAAAPAPGGTLFGAPAAAPAAFGAPPAPAPGLFGGAAPAPSGFGGGGGFGGFGTTPAPAPGAFGAPPAAPSPGGGLFGQQQPAPAPGAFGFGVKPAGTTSLFGQQPAPAAPGGGFSFGGPQPAPAGGSFFGAQPAAQQPGGLFGAQPSTVPTAGAAPSLFPQNAVIMPPATNEILAQQLRAVEKATQELKKAEAWQTNSAGKSSNSTPTSVSEAESLLMPNHYRNGLSPLYATSSSSPSFFSSPQSGAKIRPRGAGFPKTEPVKKSSATEPILSRMGRGGAATPGVSSTNGGRATMLAPDSYFRSPTLQLVVKPNSLAKPSSLSKVQFRLDMEAPSPRVDGGAAESDSPRFAAETITSPPAEYSPTPPTPGSQQQESRATTSPPGRATEHRQSTPDSSPDANSYYQQTIGATDESLSRSGQRKPSPSVPKLTKAGYETMPSLAELSAMPDADLAAVPDFVVLRPNYGAVRWEGAVDVRGANLDRAVVIEAKDVSVYSEEEKAGTKPEVGTKLNRPAILTYFEVYPKDNPAASVAEKEKFATKLEKSARRMGAQHVGYDLQSGEWKIRVDHFSRYALVDEDSEDEGSSGAMATDGGTEKQKRNVHFGDIATPQRPSSSILRDRKATPYKTTTTFSALDLSESNTEDDDEMMQTDDAVATRMEDFSEADIVDAVNASAKAAWNDIYSMAELHDSKQSSTTAKPRSRTTVVEEDDEELVYVDESDDLDEIYQPTKEELLEARKKKSISSMLATQARVGKAGIDASLRVGRSFRIAAAPDGSFVVPGLEGDTLQKFDPIFNRDINVCLKGDVLLQAHRAHCQKEYTQGSKCPPLFRLPQSYSSLETLRNTLKKFSSVDCGNSDAQVAFSLIACLLETAARGAGSNTLTVHGSSSGDDFSTRQNTAVLRWLQDVCAADVDRDITTALNRNDVPGAIFSAISGGDIEKACTVAADAGRLGLALVLATDVEGRGDIIRLIARLGETGDASAVPMELLRSLNHIAGDSRFEDTPFREGRSNLDWRRRLALRLLQEPNEDLNQIIQRYEADVKSGAAPFPSPPYSVSPSVGKNSVESIHFRIMRAMTNPGSTKLSEVVPPEGFSESIFDVSMAFHFAASLAAAGAPAPTSSDEVESFVKDYETQLVGQARWEWAVFVALCLIGDVSEQGKRRKLERAKSLVLMHYWEGDAEAEYRREFLEKELMIPSSWFSEACAGRAISMMDYLLNQIEVDADKACVALEGRFLPYVFFQSPADNEKLMQFIEAAVASDNHDSLAAAVYRFFRLKDRVQQLLEDKDEQEIAQVLPELEKVHASVESIFSSRQLQYAATVDETRYFVGPPNRRVELSSMVSEAMHHLRQLQLQLTSMRALVASSLHEEPQQDSNMLVSMEE